MENRALSIPIVMFDYQKASPHATFDYQTAAPACLMV